MFMCYLSFFSANKILPKRSTETGGVSFRNSCQKAADVLSLTIDGKQKEFDGTVTYANVKTIFKNIQKSAYFEKLNQPQQSADTPELRKPPNYFSFKFHLFRASINANYFFV